MYKFSSRSKDRLYSCDQRLIILFEEVIKFFDCSILCGHRGKDEQNAAFAAGNSSLRFPQSKHNKFPSLAVDVCPYYMHDPQIRWQDNRGFILLAGFIKGIAASKDISIRWGGDWNSNNDMKDNTFNDLVHFELTN